MAENLVPLALSSCIDETGMERIHASSYMATVRPVYVPPVLDILYATNNQTLLTGNVYSTEDGVNWNSVLDSGLGQGITAINAKSDRVLVLGRPASSPAVGRYSLDNGATWSSVSGLVSAQPTTCFYTEHLGTTRWGVFYNTGSSASTSTDGANFSSVTVENRAWYSSAVIDSIVVVGGSAGYVKRSTDGGDTFSAEFSAGVVKGIGKLMASPTAFIAVTDSITEVLRSTTGANGTWSSVATISNVHTGYAYGNGIFMLLRGNGQCRVSLDDGVTWSSGTTISGFSSYNDSYNMNILGFVNEVFVAMDMDGQVFTTPDGLTWTLAATLPVFFNQLSATNVN